mmetsp:Transcript_2200/g.7977  ORF Transcript_2200/g.7977 Transcript_2200/m.7977 type:complete len:876 (+) Transcript_2200:144-2771(+)
MKLSITSSGGGHEGGEQGVHKKKNLAVPRRQAALRRQNPTASFPLAPLSRLRCSIFCPASLSREHLLLFSSSSSCASCPLETHPERVAMPRKPRRVRSSSPSSSSSSSSSSPLEWLAGGVVGAKRGPRGLWSAASTVIFRFISRRWNHCSHNAAIFATRSTSSSLRSSSPLSRPRFSPSSDTCSIPRSDRSLAPRAACSASSFPPSETRTSHAAPRPERPRSSFLVSEASRCSVVYNGSPLYPSPRFRRRRCSCRCGSLQISPLRSLSSMLHCRSALCCRSANPRRLLLRGCCCSFSLSCCSRLSNHPAPKALRKKKRASSSVTKPATSSFVLVALCLPAVDGAVDGGRDGLDFGAELLLNLVQIVAVVVRNEVDGEAEVAEAAGAADAVQVRLRVFREIEIDHDVDRLNVDAAGEEIGRDEIAARAVPEVVKDAIAVRLDHLGVDVKARVAQLRDFAREELDAVHRVAENDRLVDLELRKEGVQAVHLLALLDKGVVLRDALQRELVHEVDDVRLAEEAVLEILHRHREGGGVEQNLTLRRHEPDDFLDERLELRAQELVRFVHDENPALIKLRDALLRQVEDATRRRDDDVHHLVQPHDVVLERGAAGRHHHLYAQVLPELFAYLRRLQGELARRHQEQRLDRVKRRVDALQHGNTEGGRLPGSILRAREDVASGERDRDALFLDGRRALKSLFVDAHEEITFQEVILKLVAFRCGDVFGAEALVTRRHDELPPPVPALLLLLLLLLRRRRRRRPLSHRHPRSSRLARGRSCPQRRRAVKVGHRELLAAVRARRSALRCDALEHALAAEGAPARPHEQILRRVPAVRARRALGERRLEHNCALRLGELPGARELRRRRRLGRRPAGAAARRRA